MYSLQVAKLSYVQIWSDAARTQVVNPLTAVFDASQDTTLYVELTLAAWRAFGPDSNHPNSLFPIQLLWRSNADEHGEYVGELGRFNSYSLQGSQNTSNPSLPFIYTDTVEIGVANPTVSIFATNAYAEPADPGDSSSTSAPGMFRSAAAKEILTTI